MKTFAEKKLTLEYSSYAENYWKGMKQRSESGTDGVFNGKTPSGLYLMPPQSEKEYCKARRNASVFRKIATSMSAYDSGFNLFCRRRVRQCLVDPGGRHYSHSGRH